MERLTTKVDDIYTCSYCENQEAINKLAEFEDFMEEQGFESLEELKDVLSNDYISQSEFKEKWVDIYSQLVDTQQTNTLIRFLEKTSKENQALKDRWQKLKEWVVSFENFLEQARVENAKRTGVYMRAKLISTESLKLKMQKLEKE